MDIKEIKKEMSRLSEEEAIEYAQKQVPLYPINAIKKPALPYKHTSVEAKQYAKDFEIWEKAEKDHKQKVSEWHKAEKDIEVLICDYIKELAELDKIPEKSRAKVWEFAWAERHSSGYMDVYHFLCDLIELFL